MRSSFWASILVASIGLFVASQAGAAMILLQANLDPFQEVPPHNTPGYGDADITLDTTANTITITSGTYNDLLAGATSVVVGDAAVGANGPTIASLTLDTPGNTSGTFSGTGIAITAAQATDMANGNTYVNVRDSVFPSGEIRGQIEMVPEPGSLSILAATGLLAIRRRRSES
jgi:hypothetical protein